MSRELLFIFTVIATIGFAMYFNLRNYQLLVATGVCGGVGYMVFLYSKAYFLEATIPTFFAAVTVGMMAEWFSRQFKSPAPVLILPGIIPLVPGERMFEMMMAFVQKDFWLALDQAIKSAFMAGSIALGILAASLFSLSLRRMRKINLSVKLKLK